MQEKWHTQNAEYALNFFESSVDGISTSVAKSRIKKYGYNILEESNKISLVELFLLQFKSPLVYILLIASVTVYFIGEHTDAFIIAFVLILNAVVGTVQEGRAQDTLKALKKLVETKCIVLRDGLEIIVDDKEIVPGDILILNAGDKVPADARLISENNISIDESAFTGESLPVAKSASEMFASQSQISEMRNMVFKGSGVFAGSGVAVVVGTGTNTVIGKLSKEITEIDTEIPLKKNIRQLSKGIIVAVGIISIVIFVTGIFTGKSAVQMFGIVVSLAVSAIPEGLPIVITIVLATGVKRMSKKNVLVRKLQSIESLGQATVIAVDKTGTITKNELTVKEVFAGGNLWDIEGYGYEPKGDIKFRETNTKVSKPEDISFVARFCAIVAKGDVFFDLENKKWRVKGDPIEAALLVFAEKAGFTKTVAFENVETISEEPFDQQKKYHSIKFKLDSKEMVIISGAPESVLSASKKVFQGVGKSRQITSEDTKEIESNLLSMAGKGLRAIAVAFKEENGDFCFLALIGMKDVLRPEAMTAVASAKKAGVSVVMITGDHLITAESIAKEAGIISPGDKIMSGNEIENLSVAELSKKIKDVKVFARVSPEHKLQIIDAMRKNGEIVAMTGDGVNDSLSLVAADLGVAMGISGTEVAKEAADMVLMDDNFGSIVKAIEEGRNIYKTTKKVILYLFSTSLGEVLVIGVSIAIGLPLPLIAAQIIWLNLVTDGFLDISIAMEHREKDILSERKVTTKLLDKLMIFRMFVMAFPMMIGGILVFSSYLNDGLIKAWTMSLTTLAVFQWLNAWNSRHELKSIFSVPIRNNWYLLTATFIVIILQCFAVYHPFMQSILKTEAISLFDWFVAVSVGSSIVFVEELRKFIFRGSQKLQKIFA